MARPFKPATEMDVRRVVEAEALLRRARDLLTWSGADKAAAATRAAIKSTGGAVRHTAARYRATVAQAEES